MRKTIDFERINSAAVGSLESLCNEWLPGGRREGHEYKAGDLSGSAGRSLSINLNSGVWRDFAGDSGGSDPVSLLAAIRGCSQADAARELDRRLSAGGVASPSDLQPAPRRPAAAEEWQAEPQPDMAGDHLVPPAHPKLGFPAAFWHYPGHGFVCRFETPHGKDIAPAAWCRSARTGDVALRWKSFRKPRPLYLPNGDEPGRGVMVVEGEKAADAAARLFPNVTVATWPGGSKAVKYADFTPLAGRRVLICPDNDEAGLQAARAIASLFPDALLVPAPAGADVGWDLADAESEGWDQSQAAAWVKANRTRANDEPPDHEPPPPEPPEGHEDAPPEPAGNARPDEPFEFLGCNDGNYYYLPHSTQQIVELPAAAHKSLQLLQLASLSFWETVAPAKSGVNWGHAANWVMQTSARLPKFSLRRIRGRGCWVDGEDVVYHAGNALIVNGERRSIHDYRSKNRFIYASGFEIPVDDGDTARNAESSRLLELCAALSWERSIFGRFLSGWCVIAPICGSLAWRPHIWITGPSGTGKSWIMGNVISPLVKKTAIITQGSTTEAGIRQTLKCDALPVVFDEIESENHKGQARVDSIMELARQASSESDGGIIRGSAGGVAAEFFIRSCFAFSSIGVAAEKRADTSRITCLTLKKLDGLAGQAEYEKIKALWRDIMVRGFADRIRARAVRLARVIRHNAEVFSEVAVTHLGDKRMGDQVGTLLAGAYSLVSANEISTDYAQRWMAAQDWEEFTPQGDDKDERKCLDHLLASPISYEPPDAPRRTLSVGEAVALAIGGDRFACDLLLRTGIRLEDDELKIINCHPVLGRYFANTAWERKWGQQLSRIAGAKKISLVRFSPGTRGRAVSVPISGIE